MKNFALIGVAGFVAPRHLKAIRETGNTLLAALDKHDNVGILDSYFPNSHFFTEFERFDRFLDKIKRKGQKIDYFSVCSPNYLHDSHIRYALRYGADAICEKPLVLNPWNLDALAQIEVESQRKINTILQLRLHPAIQQLKTKIGTSGSGKYDVDLQYVTARGNWYHASWKGDVSKSGGIVTNIGIHLFDMLVWVFGPFQTFTIERSDTKTVAGSLQLEKANVRWFLSIDAKDLPNAGNKRLTSFRRVRVDGQELEFSDGFTDLHTKSYEEILNGKGFSIEEARPSIELVYKIRKSLE